MRELDILADMDARSEFREICLACRRPKETCLCPSEPPLRTRTKIVLLMHPKEWRRQRCGTGRLACLHLADAEIIQGVAFDTNARVRELIDDPANFPALLYPGEGALDLSATESATKLAAAVSGRRITAFLVDATWACSKSVLRESPGLLRLPRLMFTPKTPSRWIIKRQPGPLCLSTIETIHELLCALESAGLETYSEKERLLDAFAAMQNYQVARALENGRPRY
jgi:DTW domain-containing protein